LIRSIRLRMEVQRLLCDMRTRSDAIHDARTSRSLMNGSIW
jgi:hypothetical protein